MLTTQDLWKAVLGEFELSMSKANFTTWFKPTYIISLRGGELILGVPNTYTKAWLEKKYHKAILNIVQNHWQEPIRTLTYRIESRGKSQEAIQNENQPLIPTAKRVEAALENAPARNSAGILPPTAVATQEVPEVQGLNPKYTFINFIVGKGNELPHAAAQAVSQKPGIVYNPLYIYGGVGLGKTHLLQAIGHELIKKNPQARVLYVTCERFTNDFIHAVRNGRAKEFKDVYRNVDLLLIDDIQFLGGKKETQEEFFHTFNALHQQNKQVALSSDRPPRAIQDLEDRLVSRFEMGMLADINNPDLETRVAILSSKARERQFNLTEEVLIEIAKIVQSNVRELEGALNKVFAHHQLQNIIPTPESVRPILVGFNNNNGQKFVSARHVVEAVAKYFDITTPDLLGKSREKRLAFPRQIAMFLLREELKCSFPTIGSELGGRDHTTAMHACEKIRGELQENQQLKNDVDILLGQIRTRA